MRQPAVAGHFYPAEPAQLREEVGRLLGRADPQAGGRAAPPALALLVPHAGYLYSGRVAGATYASAALPGSLVILCPNHTGRGRPMAICSRGGWLTPLGPAAIHERLADLVLSHCEEVEVDDAAHRGEHSLEVQIPFLQVSLGTFSFVPLCVGTEDLAALLRLGAGLGRALKEAREPVGLILSSDMSHYVTAQQARAKDMMAIERILALDPEGLHRVVRQHDITMCGYAPAVAGLAAANAAGASHARLVAYASSGDASGDYERVVGYAGVTIS